MDCFNYSRLHCTFINEEELIFECGTQKVILENISTEIPIIPMKEYDFTIESCEDGDYKFSMFECDKFNVVEIVVQSITNKNAKVHIFSHVDSYKPNHMENFVLGNTFKISIDEH